MNDKTPIRLNKYLADKGLATRRSADVLIEKGRVFVNGKRAVLGQKVISSDSVVIDTANQAEFVYILYHKPTGMVISDTETSSTILRDIEKATGASRLSFVGRLDADTEGLVLVTNDGRVTRRILDGTHAQSYKVTTSKQVSGHALNRLKRGVIIEGHRTETISLMPDKRDPYTFTISILEQKRHSVRSMCAAVGLEVQKLTRTGLGTLTLGALKPGQFTVLRKPIAKAFIRALELS